MSLSSFLQPRPGGGSPTSPPALGPVNGVPIVTAAPLNLTFTYSDPPNTAPPPQTIEAASAPAAFSVTSLTPDNVPWLTVWAPCLLSSRKLGLPAPSISPFPSI
jgi:hypothetical protein